MDIPTNLVPDPGSDPAPERAGDDERSSSTRRRLEEALAASVAEKGLPATTIADVVRLAGTSKRTFYEHFSDKDDCFLSLYRTRSDALMDAVEATLQPGAAPATVQLHDAAAAFITFLVADPALGRAHVVDISAIGERGMAVRREVVDRHATSLLRMLARADAAGTDVRQLSHTEAVCVVGGLNEIGLRALDPHDPESMTALVESATRFMQAVMLVD
ncbi:MAG: TetR/AcrR family transcriptional regulator [Ornithinibacter sp.]